MDEYLTPYRCHRAAHVLRKLGFTSRAQIRLTLDRVEGLRGVGPILKHTIEHAMALSADEFSRLFPGIEP